MHLKMIRVIKVMRIVSLNGSEEADFKGSVISSYLRPMRGKVLKVKWSCCVVVKIFSW